MLGGGGISSYFSIGRKRTNIVDHHVKILAVQTGKILAM